MEQYNDDPPAMSVVMPVYNEIDTIATIIRKVQANLITKQIVIIDDCSNDGTREFLEDLSRGNVLPSEFGSESEPDDLTIVFHEENYGKGRALHTGFKYVKGDIVLIQDADLEYDPDDYQNLIRPIESGLADVVYGSRFHGGPHRVLYFWHYVANRFLTLLSNVFTNLNLADIWTCYKAFRREILNEIHLQETGFGVEVEITAKISKQECRIYEVPIAYYGRTYEEGKKITWKDGLRGLWCIAKYNIWE